jgi:FlaA1/EpsC-like NDP-sugar epimerase
MILEYAPRFGYRAQDIAVEVIGPKPGEKLYEELISEEETRRALELDRYYVVRPPSAASSSGDASHYDGLVTDRVAQPYNSSSVKAMSPITLHQFLLQTGLVPAERRANVQQRMGML